MVLSGAPLPAAVPSGVPLLAGTDRADAIDCLATAISYEAGNEPEAGQEAVAEVVLNRVRHPAFPKTVCGVVYQGAERRTGCQFTFACDGSLLRRRAPQAMARAVATRALDGQLGPGIGEAVFYHADYVAPAWAPSLVRVGQIGAHIFYRFPGGAAGTPFVHDATPFVHDGRPAHRRTVAVHSDGVVARPQAATFAVWGLAAATVTPHGGSLEIRTE
ncbi:MAG: cell wall hydrolase [Janthinobacterium lividum]